MADLPETKKYETPDQFEAQTGYRPNPEIWKPINVAPIKLAELKAELAPLSQEAKDKRATAFIEANKVSEWAQVAPVVATVAAAWTAGSIISKSLGDATKDIKKTALKGLGFFWLLFINPKDLDPKEVAEEVKSLFEKKKNGDFFDKIFSSLQLHFLLGKAKQGGINLSEHLTPEEQKLMGILPPTSQSLKYSQVEGKWKVETITQDISFRAGYKGFVRMYYGSLDSIDKKLKPSDIDAPFQYAPFQAMTYGEAKKMYNTYKNNHSELLKQPQFKGITNAESAFAALSVLVTGNGAEFLQKRYTSGLDSLSIKDIIGGIKDTFNLAENLQDLEIESMKDLGGFMGKIGDKMDISFKDGKISEEGMKAKAEKVGLTHVWLLGFVFGEAGNRNIKTFETADSISELGNVDGPGKEKLKDIITFGKKVVPMVTEHCSMWNKEKYKEAFWDIPLSLKDITKMYIILGGKTDFTSFSEPEKLYIYQRTWHFLGAKPGFRWEFFDQPLLRAIAEDGQTVLSPEMKKMFGSIMARATWAMFEKMQWAAAELYGAMKWYHIAAIGSVLAAYLIWGKKIAWIAHGAALTTLAIIVKDVLGTFGSPDATGKYTLPSGWKITAEEGAKSLVDQIEK